MSLLEEAATDQSPLNASLKQGIEFISENQQITFNQYVRIVLPVDGYVFWVRADQLNPKALANTFGSNAVTPNQAASIKQWGPQITVTGSFHYSATRTFEEAENFTVNRVLFTSEKPVEPLNRVGPGTLWIGEFDKLKFAFGSHALLYRAASIWHYAGDAVYPDMETQLLEDVRTFSNKQIVSNSLPIWLAMNNFVPQPWWPFANTVTLYPSYAVPANLEPPWGVVHIAPDSTEAIAAAPHLGKMYSHHQLTQENVRVTLWGLRNDQAQDFADFVQQQAQTNEDFGIMNMPVVRDEKRFQSELGALAQKKVIDFRINYLQHRINNIGRQLINDAFFETIYVQPGAEIIESTS